MPAISEMSEPGKFNRTVWLSTTSTDPSIAFSVSASIRMAKRPAMELPSTDLSAQPMMLRATSVAVKSEPSFHVTPLRTFNVYCVASSFTDHDSSNIGWKEPSELYSTRYSIQPAVTYAICVQSYARGSLRARTSICMRSVPPILACAAAWAGAFRPSRP